MSGWNGYSSGSGEREPSEESGQAAWSEGRPVPPDWASAETRTNVTPPDWAAAQGHPAAPVPPPTPWTPPPPAPYPPPTRSGGARRLLVTLTATVVLGAGAGAGFWYVNRDGSTGTTATPASSVSVSADSGSGTGASTQPPASTPPASTPPASASPLNSVTPDSPDPSTGYRRAEDPTGFTVDVPEGWTRRQKTGQLAPVIFYDSPGDGRQLQIFQVSEATPAESLDLAETDPGYGFAKQPGYQVIERDRGDTWAELTYRYDDPDTGPRQIVDHRFRAADGSLYAIRAGGPADLAPERVREPLATAVRSFCPVGAQCT